jgi:putrescine aminotransferase
MIKLEELNKLSNQETNKLFRAHVNAPLAAIYKMLGLAKFDYTHAKGSYIHLKDGSKILDYTSSCGALNLGHNHPEIKKAQEFCNNEDILDMLKFGNNKLQGILAYNLSTILPEDLDTSFFAVSGAEANEAALKLAKRVQSDKKKYYIRTTGSFHGKTHGILPLTESENFNTGFHVGISPESVLTIPFNDIQALKDVIAKYPNEIIAIIVEPIQGQEIIVPEGNYLEQLVNICNKHKVITIFDEVKVGLGRTGRIFAFEDYNCIPDILTLSKSLGGGTRAISAMVTSSKLYKKAYGKKMDSTLHSSTFSGIGSSCAVAIKTLEIISNESFQNQLLLKSDYLKSELMKLKEKHPKKIKDIVGKGMYYGLKLQFPSEMAKKVNLPYSKSLEIAFMGSVVRELFKNYKILTFFTGAAPNLLHIMPPLTTSTEEIDYFIQSVDNLLEKNYLALFQKFLAGAI